MTIDHGRGCVMMDVRSSQRKTPCVVATGFTTAYLGDERSLREFIVGDAVKNQMIAKGDNAVLYLINDSYDPLTYRQLRVAMNKDEALIDKHRMYCGRPIAEIPDPFGCHESYAGHFAQALLERLRSLDIHPVLIDAYRSYDKGYYADYIRTTFEHYADIQRNLAERFDSYSISNLFRPQCPKCLCLDQTHILGVERCVIRFTCRRCDQVVTQDVAEIRGKLSWKIDCAARWNLYGIDMETFSKQHVDRLGSYAVSGFLSREFFGGRVPEPIRYGAVMLTRELSYRLLEILPPVILKALFADHMERDLLLTKESVEQFCHKFQIRPGTSFVDFVKQELPIQAISRAGAVGTEAPARYHGMDDAALIRHGNRFSGFYYGKEYNLSFAAAEAIPSGDRITAKRACDIVRHALALRAADDGGEAEIKNKIMAYLRDRKSMSGVFPYLRRIFGQQGGPSITTLLACLPREYLTMIQMMLAYYTDEAHGASADDAVDDGGAAPAGGRQAEKRATR